MADQKMTDTQIQEVFKQLGLSDSTNPPAPPAQPVVPPSSPPLYFPLSADSLSPKKTS